MRVTRSVILAVVLGWGVTASAAVFTAKSDTEAPSGKKLTALAKGKMTSGLAFSTISVATGTTDPATFHQVNYGTSGVSPGMKGTLTADLGADGTISSTELPMPYQQITGCTDNLSNQCEFTHSPANYATHVSGSNRCNPYPTGLGGSCNVNEVGWLTIPESETPPGSGSWTYEQITGDCVDSGNLVSSGDTTWQAFQYWEHYGTGNSSYCDPLLARVEAGSGDIIYGCEAHDDGFGNLDSCNIVSYSRRTGKKEIVKSNPAVKRGQKKAIKVSSR